MVHGALGGRISPRAAKGSWARLNFTNDGRDGVLLPVLREGSPVLQDGALRVVRLHRLDLRRAP
jgi:hypothetical protein